MSGKSIITNDMEHCYLCMRRAQQMHHCIYGSRRKLADEDGLVVPLCFECHNEVHNGDGHLAKYLKRVAQIKYEELHSHDEWMQRYGKNYI